MAWLEGMWKSGYVSEMNRTGPKTEPWVPSLPHAGICPFLREIYKNNSQPLSMSILYTVTHVKGKTSKTIHSASAVANCGCWWSNSIIQTQWRIHSDAYPISSHPCKRQDFKNHHYVNRMSTNSPVGRASKAEKEHRHYQFINQNWKLRYRYIRCNSSK